MEQKIETKTNSPQQELAPEQQSASQPETQPNVQIPQNIPETQPQPEEVNIKVQKEPKPKSRDELFAEIDDNVSEYEKKLDPMAAYERKKPALPSHSQQPVHFTHATDKTIQRLDTAIAEKLNKPEADEGQILQTAINTINRLPKKA